MRYAARCCHPAAGRLNSGVSRHPAMALVFGEEHMEIVDALAKLSFSFWQVVVMISIILFRKEIKEIAQRIATFKVAGTEITWSQKSNVVESLENLKADIEKSDNPDKDAVKLIEERIQNKLILALANIKNGTTYLWPDLVKAKLGSSIFAPIRQQTLDRIKPELDALSASNLISYDIEMDKLRPNGVHMISVTSITQEFCRLVELVEHAY